MTFHRIKKEYTDVACVCIRYASKSSWLLTDERRRLVPATAVTLVIFTSFAFKLIDVAMESTNAVFAWLLSVEVLQLFTRVLLTKTYGVCTADVGYDDGCLDGTAVGSNVGTRVGAMLYVGTTVGVIVGITVGVTEGFTLG